MSEQWFYVSEGAQKGPVAEEHLGALVQQGLLQSQTLVWKNGMAEWRPAGEVHGRLFPVEHWFYLVNGAQQGPVDMAGLSALVRGGTVQAGTLVWKAGMAEWVPASRVPGLAVPPAPSAPPPAPAGPQRGMLGGIGAKLSEMADLPTISNVPIKDILMGGASEAWKFEPTEIEDEFAVGTRKTTPSLAEIPSGWPRARLAWRVLGAAVVTYLLMWYGMVHMGNPNFLPGMIAVGSFLMPLSVVILCFEMNTPRNVSAYRVGEMLLLGGALSLIISMVGFRVIPGSGTGDLVPAMLTGVIEETGKALALLVVLYSPRYPWQINGLLFGACVGAGFGGFESAGYAVNIGPKLGGLAGVVHIIWIRGLLAPGMHVAWTAIVGSGIWKAKGDQPFSLGMLLHPVAIRRWVIAVVLHGLWDMDLPINGDLHRATLLVIAWYYIFAIMKQSIADIEAAKARAGVR